jgi:hypothetical protein
LEQPANVSSLKIHRSNDIAFVNALFSVHPREMRVSKTLVALVTLAAICCLATAEEKSAPPVNETTTRDAKSKFNNIFSTNH